MTCKHAYPKTDFTTPRSCLICGHTESDRVEIKNLGVSKAWKEFKKAKKIKRTTLAGMFIEVWNFYSPHHPAFLLTEEEEGEI